jgi:transposase-like protein
VQYCPYCGEQDLRPREEHADEVLTGAWECADCRSTFVVSRSIIRTTSPLGGTA